MVTGKARKIVEIDEAKCDGCGLCVPSCAEGAIQIIDGKARLVSDVYCDGLGACLGHCPQDAIRIVERPAEAFDEEAARQHVAGAASHSTPAKAQPRPAHGGCPGAAMHDLRLNVMPARRPPALPVMPPTAAGRSAPDEPSAASGLANWPVQLHLAPPTAPYFQQADLLLVADCVPFACADFHARFLDGRPVVIGCPKLDDGSAYVDKLARILSESSVRSVTVVHMEVPCCTGLVRIARAAIALCGRPIPLHDATVSIRGQVLETQSA